MKEHPSDRKILFDLLGRAVAAEEAARTIELPYTYQLSGWAVTPEQRQLYVELGGFAAEMSRKLADDLLSQAFQYYKPSARSNDGEGIKGCAVADAQPKGS